MAMTDREITELLLYAAETWQNFALPTHEMALETRLQVWRDFFGDLDQPLVRSAIGATGDRPWPPPPGELRRVALRLAGEKLPPDPDEAVAEIMRAVTRVGYTGSPGWSHPAIGATVDAFGGWRVVCESSHPESMRAHLLKLYGIAAERLGRSAVLAPTFAELLPNLGDEARELAAGPPAETRSALRSPSVSERDDDEGLRAVSAAREAIEDARREAAE